MSRSIQYCAQKGLPRPGRAPDPALRHTRVSLHLSSLHLGVSNACFSGFLTFFHQVAPRPRLPAAGAAALQGSPRWWASPASLFPFPPSLSCFLAAGGPSAQRLPAGFQSLTATGALAAPWLQYTPNWNFFPATPQLPPVLIPHTFGGWKLTTLGGSSSGRKPCNGHALRL